MDSSMEMLITQHNNKAHFHAEMLRVISLRPKMREECSSLRKNDDSVLKYRKERQIQVLPKLIKKSDLDFPPVMEDRCGSPIILTLK